MKVPTILSVALVALACLPVAAQKDNRSKVDWDAKAIATELGKLGDPEINMFLPELYKALRHQNADSSESEKRVLGKGGIVIRPNLLSLLANPGVREEIEMVDEQYEEILQKSREIQSDLTRDIGSLVLSADGKIDREQIRQKISDIREAAKKELEHALLPFQVKRLQQIAYQVDMRRHSVVSVLTRDPLASELNLTEEQKTDLKKKAKEIDQRVSQEIARLQAKAREELFSELRSDQRRKLADLIGKDIELEETSWFRKAVGKSGSKLPSKPKIK